MKKALRVGEPVLIHKFTSESSEMQIAFNSVNIVLYGGTNESCKLYVSFIRFNESVSWFIIKINNQIFFGYFLLLCKNHSLFCYLYVAKAMYDRILGPSVKTDGNSNLGLKPFLQKNMA